MAHHGNTPAAWTGVLIILVGFTVGGLGLVVSSWPMFWVGVVIGVVGPVVGKVMQKMGLGAEPASESRR
ncbi:MAG: HGxxPAAW family protein [Nocardioidaceae bacterium]